MSFKRQLFVLFLCLATLVCSSLDSFASIIIDGYTDATNDRFTNDPAFVMSSFDLSGIGQVSSGRWATAVSRNVIISASHADPGKGQTVYFYANNDPASTPVLRQIASTQSIAGTDIILGVLNAPLPSSIAHYAIANQTLSGPPPTPAGGGSSSLTFVDAGIYQGLNAYTFGWSPFNEALPGDNRELFNDQAVGRNLISGYSENVPFTSSDNDSLILLRDAAGTSNHVQYESLFQEGDSGGPTFVEIGGQLVLAGTNSFRFEDNSGSGINYLGNQSSAIQNYIQVNAVPEPSSAGMLGLASLLAWAGRRRRRVG